jgi:hypothetical protein
MCLKNALERGADMEKAKRSLTNAGYSQSEINSAAQELEGKMGSRHLDVPRANFFPKLPKPPKR